MKPDTNEKIPSNPGKPGAESQAGEKLGLEDIVHLANRIGLEYVQAKKEADRLELADATFPGSAYTRVSSQAGPRLKRAPR